MGESSRKQGTRKQITFDLSQKALEKHYPRPAKSVNPKYYKKAYSDISQFMKKNGFEHRQFSVYNSIEKMTMADVTITMQILAVQMPWLYKCINEIDVTNIGSQHSVKQIVEFATIDFALSHDEQSSDERVEP